MREQLGALRISELLFSKFMYAYSAKYREEFGDEIAQVFRDLCQDIYQHQGAAGLAKLLLEAIWDLLKTAAEERLGHGPGPSKQQLVLFGSWSAIGAGLVTFVFALTHASPDWIHWVFKLEWIWPVLGMLYLAGLIGIRAYQHLREESSGIVQTVAFVGAGVMTASGFLMLFLNRIWISYGNGLIVLAAGLLMMALKMLHIRGRSHLSVALLCTGIFTLLLSLFIPSRYMGELFDGDASAFALLMGMSWIAIGLILRSRQDSQNPTHIREA